MEIETYFRMAYAALIVIFTFCGILRQCNLWPQSEQTPDELYPARRIVTCIYFSVLLLLPCVLHPQSHDAQLLARCFWILFIPAATSLGYKRFFFGDTLHRRLRVAIVGGVPLAAMLVLSCIAFAGGDMLSPYRGVTVHLAGILGALLTAYLLHVMLWLWHIRSGADVAARSADRLFPHKFASGMLLLSAVVLVLTWTEFLFGSFRTNIVLAAVIALTGAGVILVILHPQRLEKKDVDEEKDTMQMPVKTIDRIEGQVRDAMERDQMFLDPEVSVDMLAACINVNKKYLNTVLRLRFGKFKTYLNALRMEYSILYMKEHPDAKSEEVAIKCGFGSSRSYYRARNDYVNSQKNGPIVTKQRID